MAPHGKAQSLWMATSETSPYVRLDRDVRADVAIVGGGITGLTAAHALQQAGLSVVVLEQQPLVAGTTGHTTAHLTQVFDTPLDTLRRHFGDGGAMAVWQAGRLAIDHIEATARNEQIDCGFRRVPGYYVAARERDVELVQAEAASARELGFVADFVRESPYPLGPYGAMRVARQAQMHPRRYVLGLAARVAERGGAIFERTHVAAVHPGAPARLEAEGWVVSADHVVLATHQPLLDTALVTKVISHQSYAVAARVARGTFEQALAWDSLEPYHYWRQQPDGDADMLIVGGQDHRTGHDDDPQRRFEALERYLREALGDTPFEVAYRWSHQWLDPVDGVPFIGKSPAGEHFYVGTGYAGNGITMGTYAGLLITDLILGRAHPAAALFDPGRIRLRAGGVTFLRENMAFPEHLLRDRFGVAHMPKIAALGPGEGAVVDVQGRKVAACRTEDGRLHAVSAVCSHMGCLVHWNNAAATWDCPCHGSRYEPDGAVITGPTMRALEPVDVPEPQRPGTP